MGSLVRVALPWRKVIKVLDLETVFVENDDGRVPGEVVSGFVESCFFLRGFQDDKRDRQTEKVPGVYVVLFGVAR